MATRALTPFAQRQSRDNLSARKGSGRGRDWRQVLLSQDAEAIWQELSILVRLTDLKPSTAPESANERGFEQMTQELFLRLLTTDRFSFYLKQGYSDADIREDLITILNE